MYRLINVSLSLSSDGKSILASADIKKDGTVLRNISTSLSASSESADLVDDFLVFAELVVEREISTQSAIDDAMSQLEGHEL